MRKEMGRQEQRLLLHCLLVDRQLPPRAPVQQRLEAALGPDLSRRLRAAGWVLGGRGNVVELESGAVRGPRDELGC